MPISLYDPTWRALARESGMAGRLICSGLTALRRASSSVEAVYYEGFFGLTIGLERTCKLAIIVSDFVQKGTFPTDKQLKAKYGHNLKELIKEVQARVARGELSTSWAIPSGPEADSLVDFLTEFAKTSRYYNVSFLGGAAAAAEPITAWVDLVLKHHPQRPSTPTEANNLAGMKMLDETIGHAFLILQIDEHGNPIEDFHTGAVHALTTEHVRKQGTMMCARLARSLADALGSLGYASTATGDVLPVFGEFFGILFNDDKYLSGRKTFNSPL